MLAPRRAPIVSSPPPSTEAPYREVTVAAVVTGILAGVVMSAAVTYSGLKIGFTIGGSAIGAVVGWGVLRGILKRGTVVEANICQTIASSINISNSGLIFTVPVLFLLGSEFSVGWLTAACVAGAILGVAFIIPTRKQMIDFERLRFPTGTAVATVLRSPGEGVRKAWVLLVGIALAMAVVFFKQAQTLGLPGWADLGAWLGLPGVTNEDVDVGAWILRIPFVGEHLWSESFTFVWALAPFALGAGFITGPPGLVILAGGVLAYFVLAPVALSQGWLPPDTLPGDAGEAARGAMSRPLGIGMLMGGALVSLAVAFPAIGAALRSMRTRGGSNAKLQELSIVWLYVAVGLAFALLFVAALRTIEGSSAGQALVIALVGTAWIWFSGIVVAQCTGMTDWSPISGMALLTVMLCLLLTGNQVVPAVLIGAAVCVATILCADMMQDLKTGSLVGGIPRRQQLVELSVVWIGPLVSMATVFLIAEKNQSLYGAPFGAGTDRGAPQAAALHAAIDGLRGGSAPVHLYGMGGLMGILLSASGFTGLGVLVGLSMYLPLAYLLPYGLGCVIQMVTTKVKGATWAESWGVPLAAGLIVGDGLLEVVFAAVHVLGEG